MTHPTITLRDWEVRALLAGATQLRRPVKPQPVIRVCETRPSGCHDVQIEWNGTLYRAFGAKAISLVEFTAQQFDAQSRLAENCPYGKPGDVLLCKEVWATTEQSGDHKRDAQLVYRATDPDWSTMEGWRWRPAQTMPAWAVRIKPVLASVRVKRVQEADAEDVDAMGLPEGEWSHVDSMRKFEFSQLWDEWHGPGSFAANPWCWQLVFEPPTAARPQE